MDYTDILIHDLKNLPEYRKELETAENQLLKEWKKRQIADIERLLNELDDIERLLITALFVEGKRDYQVASENGVTVREIRFQKNDALDHLLQLRYGAAYQP